jgi:hypothetical protein
MAREAKKSALAVRRCGAQPVLSCSRCTLTRLPLSVPAASLRTASRAMPRSTATYVVVSVTLILPTCFLAETGLSGQRAEHVAGTDLVLAPAEDLQGGHGRQQGRPRLARRLLQFAQGMPFDLVAEGLFDVVDACHLVAADQAESPACLVDAPGAADAMDMDLGVRRDIDVDHRLQLVDVEAARGDVGGDQHRAAAVGELHQHLVAFALLHLAVQGQGDEAFGAQHLVQQVAALLARIAEGQGADRAIVVQQQADRSQLRSASTS